MRTPILNSLLRASGDKILRVLSTIYIRLTLATAKRIAKLRDKVILVAITECRQALDLPLPGENVELDRSLLRLVLRHFNEPEETQCADHKELYSASEWLSSNTSDLRKTFMQCQAWMHEKTDNKEELESLREKYSRDFEAELSPIDVSEINALLSKSKKRLMSANKQFRRSKANKISIDFSHLTSALPLISAALTISGFLYCQLYFGHFGIPVAEVFTLTDYLSSSIEQIGTVLLAFVAYFVGMIRVTCSPVASPV